MERMEQQQMAQQQQSTRMEQQQMAQQQQSTRMEQQQMAQQQQSTQMAQQMERMLTQQSAQMAQQQQSAQMEEQRIQEAGYKERIQELEKQGRDDALIARYVRDKLPQETTVSSI
jgi:hypothetical protein